MNHDMLRMPEPPDGTLMHLLSIVPPEQALREDVPAGRDALASQCWVRDDSLAGLAKVAGRGHRWSVVGMSPVGFVAWVDLRAALAKDNVAPESLRVYSAALDLHAGCGRPALCRSCRACMTCNDGQHTGFCRETASKGDI